MKPLTNAVQAHRSELDNGAEGRRLTEDAVPADVFGSELSPHFVLKRGHLGRYRFALLVGDDRLKGEVRIASTGSRECDEKAALDRIAFLIGAFGTAIGVTAGRRRGET